MSVSLGDLVDKLPGGRFLVEHEPPELDPRTTIINDVDRASMTLGNVVSLSFGRDVARAVEASASDEPTEPTNIEQTQADLGGVATGAEYAPTDGDQPLPEDATGAYLDNLAA